MECSSSFTKQNINEQIIRDDEKIKECIKHQEQEDKRIDQLKLLK